MIRNLKAMGLALMAVLALGAVVASTASAQQGKLTSDGPVTLIGEETGEATANRLTAFGANVTCPGSIYTGHAYNATPHGPISSGATTATLTPHYKERTGPGVTPTTGEENCFGPFGWSATVDMNGCDYVIHLGETTGGVAHTYGVTFDVVCPTGQEITVTLWTSKADHTSKPTKPFCILHVPGVPVGMTGHTPVNQGLTGGHATYTTANKEIDLTGPIKGITVKRTAQADDPSPVLCPTTTSTTGEFDLDVTVRGVDSSVPPKPTEISISE